MRRFIFVFALLSSISQCAACDIRLKHAVPTCPATTESSADCLTETWGRAGDPVTHPATIHIMTNGQSFLCPSHEGCVQLKDVISKCTLTFIDRKPGESQ